MAESQPAEPGHIHTGPISSGGITMLYTPPDPIVDICFVHGFMGHPRDTWTYNKRSNAEPVYWPRDLVPDLLPKARVFTFGYDSTIKHFLSGQISQNSLSGYAADFLYALEGARRQDITRPLMFIAHSLGGLVVKETLRLSLSFENTQLDRSHVYMSTSSLLFFGTPHMGADPYGALRRLVSFVAARFGFRYNKSIIQTLLPNEDRLKILADDFAKWAKDRNWSIYTFQEEVGTGLGEKIVEDHSSTLNHPHEKRVHIYANHVDMCKFKTSDDPEFLKVSSALLEEQGKLVEAQPQGASSILSRTDIEAIVKRLEFNEMELRYMSLEEAQQNTCRWLLEHPVYQEWVDPSRLEEHHGFLWIKGKPGSGKSTFMKYLYDNTEMSNDRIVLKFFFHARGTDLEHSIEGMYRSLLWQLIQTLCGTGVPSDGPRQLLKLKGTTSWPIPALKNAFRLILSQIKCREVYCFVDALDECPENDLRETLSFFEKLGEYSITSRTNIRFCFASRHFPKISLSHNLELFLEAEDGQSNDLRHYIRSQLRINSPRRQEIEDEIVEKSSRIFLWVEIVVKILNKLKDRGGDISVRHRLRQIPRGLDELFHDILTRDNENIEDMVLCIQWILFAKKPLEPKELYFAMQIGNQTNVSGIWDRFAVSEERIDDFILNAHKGLAEKTQSTKIVSSKVQFIHESVREYLLDKGLPRLFTLLVPASTFSEKMSHDVLKRICLDQINGGYRLKTSTHDPSSRGEMPFFTYARLHVLSHADSAQSIHTDQSNFLTHVFPIRNWVSLHNSVQIEQSRQYSTEVDLLYILAELNLGNLISTHPQRDSWLKKPKGKERFSNPLVAAMASGNKEAVIALALAAAKKLSSPSQLPNLDEIREELERNNRQLKKSIGDPVWKNIDLFWVFCSLGSVTLIDTVLDGLLAMMNITIEKAMENIQCATNHDVYQYLLDKGLDITSKSKTGKTALDMAVKADELEMAEYLLGERADPNAIETTKIPSLDEVKSGSMTSLLIKHGACVGKNIGRLVKKPLADDFFSALGKLQGPELIACLRLSPQSRRHTLLHLMLRDGDKRVLPLLETTLSSNNQLVYLEDDRGDSLLKLAASYNDSKTLMALCEVSEADVNSQNSKGCTALCGAISCWNCPTIISLLNLDARSNHLETNTICCPLKQAIPEINPLVDNEMDVLRALLERSSNCVDIALVSKAIQSQHFEITEPLLSLYYKSTKYEGINMKGDYGHTLLSTAAKAGNVDIVRRLLTNPDIDVNCLNYNDLPPLSIATEHGNVGIVKLLLHMPDINVNYQTKYGLNALHSAVSLENVEILELLLRHPSINCNIATSEGYTPLYEAAREGKLDMVRLLLSHDSINPNFGDSLGRNPVLWAARHAASQVVRLLLIHPRVNKQQRCRDGRSLSDLAAENEDPDVLKLVQQMQ
ncbi:ankyrin [Nemania sp. FL0031]|nr:ankyrin [Nemania sp. FL0031]